MFIQLQVSDYSRVNFFAVHMPETRRLHGTSVPPLYYLRLRSFIRSFSSVAPGYDTAHCR